MLKFTMLLSVILASVIAEASFDVSFPTINGKPAVEIVKNGKVCIVEIEWKEFNAATTDEAQKELAMKALKECRSR